MIQHSASTLVIDADSHLTEPPDLWTSNLPAKWRELGPHTALDPSSGIERWRIGDKWLAGVSASSHSGWPEFSPSKPPKFEDIDPMCYDVHQRARWQDENGVAAQILYPNVIAFEGHAVMALNNPGLQLAIVQTYNDYQTDFAAKEPGRFIPIAVLPFWDLDASIREMQRCAAAGHKGVLWAAQMAKHGLPGVTTTYWDPFYRAAEEAGMSINLHIGVGWTAEELGNAAPDITTARSMTTSTAMGFMSNVRTVTDFIMDGVCARFPKLNIVSVESGFGWMPFLLDTLDWQWKNYDGPRIDREFDLLPSEYFRRQVYGMFWFEHSTLSLFEGLADNIMFETDFPHTTSLSSGLGSASPGPRAIVESVRKVLTPTTFQKVMYGNAARVYGL